MINTLICYFSGSGNSYDAAIELGNNLHGAILKYIPNTSYDVVNDYEEVIIVTPVYAFNIPSVVQDFISSMEKGTKYHVVFTCAGTVGKSRDTVMTLSKRKDLLLLGMYKVMMPSSFTTMLNYPKFLTKKVLKRSRKKIYKVAQQIHNNENNCVPLKKAKRVLSEADPFVTFSDNLEANKNCTKCGYCIKICPRNNIKFMYDELSFSNQCISCYACVNRCPNNAIEYNGKKIKQYINPNVDFNRMNK